MSINTNIGTNLGVMNPSSVEGQTKESANHSAVSTQSHSHISNRVISYNNLIAGVSYNNSDIGYNNLIDKVAIQFANSITTTNLASELAEFPKLQRMVTLHFVKGPFYKLFSQIETGDHLISFTAPNQKTTRWAGAILDQFGLYSRGMRRSVEEKRKSMEENYSDVITLKSTNATHDVKTGSGLREIIEKPVLGMSGTMFINGFPKVVIQSLIVNESEKRAVLTMLAIFHDIEDELVSHLISPLVEIVRGYCDWTDTGLEARQRVGTDEEIEIVLAAVYSSGLALASASINLRADRDVVLAAIR